MTVAYATSSSKAYKREADPFKGILFDSQSLSYQYSSSKNATLHRTLQQIDLASTKLSGGRTWALDQSGQALLASRGFDVAKFTESLESVQWPSLEPAIVEPVDKLTLYDLEDFMRSEQERIILAAIEGEQCDMLQSLQSRIEKALYKDLETSRKNRGLLARKSHPSPPLSSSSSSSQTMKEARPSVPLFSSALTMTSHHPTTMDTRQQSYAQIVKELNESRLKYQIFPVCMHFLQSSGIKESSESSNTMTDIWKLLATITDERALTSSSVNLTQLRKENEGLWRQPYDSPAYVQQRTRLTERTKTYLEKSYIDFVDRLILQFPKEAKLGGKPSLSEKVRAYLNVKYGRIVSSDDNIEIVENSPIWAHLFYLLRCGDYSSLVTFAQQYEPFFQRVDRCFVDAVRTFVKEPNHILSGDLRSSILKEYQRMRRAELSHDPFKIMLYCILGRADVTSPYCPTSVIATIEDWIWLQLTLVREGMPGFALKDLQSMVKEFGPTHFNARRADPLLYFKTLLLCGLYESGLFYLFDFEECQMHAVHVAIVLAYHGLLKISSEPDRTSEAAPGDPNEVFYFAPMIRRYASSFIKSNFVASFHYILLMSLVDRSDYYLTTVSNLKDWAIVTREFSFAFGHQAIEEKGLFVPGELDKWTPFVHLTSGYLQSLGLSHWSPEKPPSLSAIVAIETARQFEEEGKLEDAMPLYHLAREYQKVLEILAKRISDALVTHWASMSGLGSMDEVVATAQSILEFYQRLPDRSLVQTSSFSNAVTRIGYLIGMHETFKAAQSGQWQACLSMAQSYSLIHSSGTNNGSSALSLLMNDSIWKEGESHLARHVPNLLLSLMKCISECYHGLGPVDTAKASLSPVSKSSLEARKSELKKLSRHLLMFAGKNATRLPHDVYPTLTRYDALLN